MSQNRIKISAVVLTKNEESVLVLCLISLKFADEILVIDDNSIDKTRIVSKKYGAKVYRRNLNGDFASQRNFGLKMAKGEWVFFVDADEMVPKKLSDEIEDLVQKEENVGYFLQREDYFLGRKMRFGEVGSFGMFGNAKILRLAKKRVGKWTRAVHERWQIHGAVEVLKNKLLHYPHETLFEFIDDIGVRSEIHSRELISENKDGGFFKVMLWPIAKLVNNMIFKLGILDGTHGFVLAMFMSFHSFLSWSNVWMSKKLKN